MTGKRIALATVLCCALSLLGGTSSAGKPGGDPLRVHQWGLSQIHGDLAWKRSTARRVVVAVVDMGVDARHPDLRGHVLPGKDFEHGTRNAWHDIDGHGTEVAGIIAARRDNGLGIAGVAPDALILPVKVGESGTVSHVPEGIVWAADHGARVINVSAGTLPAGELAFAATGVSALYQQAVDHAWKRGAVVVAGAGNNSTPWCSEPAARSHVLCVGSVDKRGLHTAYSQEDAALQCQYLVAPGGSDVPLAGSGLDELIWTTTVRGTGTQVQQKDWDEVAGTSYAAPFVSGVAALLAARGMTNAQIVRRILATTTDLGPAGRDPVYGYGEVDAARAVG